MAEKKAQISLEALISAAALLAFLAVLIHAASEAASQSTSFSSSLNSQSRADLLALTISFHSADARLTSFTQLQLGNCSLTVDSVRCENATAQTLANNSGGERYEFFPSLPA